jgi:hypothetical protein
MNVLKRFNSGRSIYNRPLNVPRKATGTNEGQESYLIKSPTDNSMDTMLFALESAENRGLAVFFPGGTEPPVLNPLYVVAGYVLDGYVVEETL